MITAILAALLLLVPVSVTTAYLTDRATADQTTGGVGRWCSVPNPAENPNVYRLKDFPTYSSNGSSMIIVPVVRNGEFGSGGGDGRLGVRTWACDSTRLTNNSTLKVTSWRNSSGSGSINWRTQASTLAASRLDPASGLGARLSFLHREGSTSLAGAELTTNDRQLYSWIVSSNRTKTNRDAFPSCATSLCWINIEAYPTFSNAFTGDTSGSRTLDNSVQYLASSYWINGGDFDKSAAHPVNLAPYANNIDSFDGRQVQWVVMEWWGSTTPSNDMVVEVFVR
ncbi:hypothetical protein [Brevibacterium spongiae]|uniref:Uncharacterized protein n=1 Tax=Brevibacterium spongiae TaxID=2909672 RepID=A0ABY5SNT7_9MICO|nr:hypothetical protein [Brevibacterium spongiae]UVI35965.1 hypothetical protein L1F31_17915 [Brevibacterium spongiae]WGP06033.1 hypothetical protein QFE97_18250 [Bacillus subtilis]